MIHVYMRGRLGNQLFQYAFVRSLQHYNPDQKVCYHFDDVYSAGSPKSDFINALKYFNTIDVEESDDVPNLSFSQKILLRAYWFRFPHSAPIHIRTRYQKKWVNLLDKYNLKYLDIGFYLFRNKLKGDVIVSGNFESELYFKEIKEQILREIMPKFPVSEKNLPLLEKMRSTNSVLMSIRRGDFIDNPHVHNLHAVCTKLYYERALDYMKSHIENPVLFIFSNDIEWVKCNLHFDVETYYESGHDSSWEVLELMSNCKHFIISNSTFNWWAQYKSRNKDKIVVAPNRWWNSPLVPDIFMDDWILMPVD